VVNDDGTCAVLNINQSQGVAGWTELTTDGDILELAEVDGGLFATVQRTVDGDDYVFLEKFDYDRHTDACVRLELGSSSTMTNLDHLATATVQVRADDMTMEPQVVSGGGEVSVLSGDVPIPSDVRPAWTCTSPEEYASTATNYATRRLDKRSTARRPSSPESVASKSAATATDRPSQSPCPSLNPRTSAPSKWKW
jgi:hypothetical protein